MKVPRILLPLVLCPTIVLAQPGGSQPVAQPGAEKSFALLKSLAGTWQGSVQASSDELQPEVLPHKGNPWPAQVTLRVTSRGNAIVHEMWNPQVPDDPARYDHPTTVFYLDGDRLMLTHYCDMGNRPSMAARSSPVGNTIEFDLVSISGPLKIGYMNQAIFTPADANHHGEDWMALVGGKTVKFHLTLQRQPPGNAGSGQ